MTAPRVWFQGRTARERQMILVMLALFALVILWAGIIRPVTDGLASARDRHGDAVLRLADAERQVAAVKALNQDRPAPLGQPLGDYIRQSAGNAGFALSNVATPSDARIDLTIATARPGALFHWIADIEAAGVVIDTIHVTDNGDRTVAAQMTLLARGQ